MGPMAKKNQNKKHKFKYAEPTAGTQVTRPASPKVAATTPARTSSGAAVRDFSYVTHDLRRIVILAVGLIALEVLLWGALEHTSLGETVFRLVQV